MAKTPKVYSLVFPITFGIMFAALSLVGAIFFFINEHASNEFANPNSPNYDQSGLGATGTFFAGILIELAMILFGLLALIFLIDILIRIHHNKKIKDSPLYQPTPTQPRK